MPTLLYIYKYTHTMEKKSSTIPHIVPLECNNQDCATIA